MGYAALDLAERAFQARSAGLIYLHVYPGYASSMMTFDSPRW